MPEPIIIDDSVNQAGYPPADLKPGPTVTAPLPVASDPTPTIDPHRRPDPSLTASATTPDNSFWFAFDTFDDIGGSPPYSQKQGLYRQKDGLITHFDIPGPIRVLEVDPGGDLYVGAACGVMRFKDESFEMLLDPNCDHRTSVTKLFPMDITFADDGTVWVGGAYSLASFKNGSWIELELPAVRVAVASDGTIWTRGWDGRANSACCLTHITGTQWITYAWTSDVPAEPAVLNSLLGQPNR